MNDQEKPLFDPGDVVALVGGSPPMTVDKVHEPEPELFTYEVIWIDVNYHVLTYTFPEHLLCSTHPIHFCCPELHPEDDDDPEEQWKHGPAVDEED